MWPGDYRYPGQARTAINHRHERETAGRGRRQGERQQGGVGGNRVFSRENSEITRRVVPLSIASDTISANQSRDTGYREQWQAGKMVAREWLGTAAAVAAKLSAVTEHASSAVSGSLLSSC